MDKRIIPAIITASAIIIAAVISRINCKPKPPESDDTITPEVSVEGSIIIPHNNDFVLRVFDAKGTIRGLPSNFSLWLVVEHSNLSWPKGPIKISKGSWAGRVYEGGSPPKGSFSLALYMVNSDGSQKITEWLESGRKSGYYPGFMEIKGGTLLDRIDLKLKE